MSESEKMARRLQDAAVKRSVTVGTAESCTGGKIAAALTEIPGSSDYVLGGIVSYANSVKQSVLGVPAEVLESVGAVSAECARNMAYGAAKCLGCDFAVSVTGIAGPGGGSDEKPVGTVWFGLRSPGCEKPDDVKSEKCVFTGNRAEVREQTVRHALALLIEAVESHE